MIISKRMLLIFSAVFLAMMVVMAAAADPADAKRKKGKKGKKRGGGGGGGSGYVVPAPPADPPLFEPIPQCPHHADPPYGGEGGDGVYTGDSLTYGYGGNYGGYPAYVAHETQSHMHNYGQCGARSYHVDEVLGKIPDRLEKARYISVGAGLNDILADHRSADEYQRDAAQALDRVLASCSPERKRTVWVMGNDVGSDYDHIRPDVYEYNRRLKEEADKRGFYYVDIPGAFSKGSGEMFSDGIHYSDAGNKAAAEAMLGNAAANC